VSLTCTAYHYSSAFAKATSDKTKHSLISKCFLFFITITLILSCSSTKKNGVMNNEVQKALLGGWGAFDKQGHRGCRGLMPENTIPAMLHALSLGVTTLEMDVVFTKDSVAILSHEPFFNHEITTKANGGFIDEKDEKNYNIYKMAFAETQQYEVGLKPHPRFAQQQKMAVHKPALAAMFDSVKTYMMTRRRPFPYFNIETKTQPATDNIFHPAPEVFVDMLMKVIDEKQLRDFVTIQSFDIRTLQYLHKEYASVSTALLIEDFDKRTLEVQLKELGFTPSIYSPHYSLVTDELIKKSHEQKIKVIPWTVNDKKEIERLKSMGVDGIITDYPNLFNE
jgi:glycerophosphoryl diester phosphodiesterase